MRQFVFTWSSDTNPRQLHNSELPVLLTLQGFLSLTLPLDGLNRAINLRTRIVDRLFAGKQWSTTLMRITEVSDYNILDPSRSTRGPVGPKGAMHAH